MAGSSVFIEVDIAQSKMSCCRYMVVEKVSPYQWSTCKLSRSSCLPSRKCLLMTSSHVRGASMWLVMERMSSFEWPPLSEVSSRSESSTDWLRFRGLCCGMAMTDVHDDVH